MKDVLKELKFFTNNDFAFIDVHNEKLFYQNFEVLLKIAKMIQDIRLKGSEENQFLGDMFEGFLDQGVKQSEGQFFTPMPIVKFIINALPNKQNPNVIDYACGAGHFLNEYFTTNKGSHIIGVEKEYRLSKVAKVSSFMYGSNIDIIYADALSSNAKINNDTFNVLVANPPYSVKGFLETLSDEERQKYDLLKTIDAKSYTANNAIECFFIERAKQLLAKEGVAGIIVPSSILNKGAKNNVYVKTREILLRYFDIIAIAEFGSGTFGKTGTNTVTLFLKRRCDKENLSGNFEELARNIFTCKEKADAIFKDKGLLEAYCQHINVDVTLYKTLLCDKSDEKLFLHDIFKEYKQAYEKLNPQIKKKIPLSEFIKEIEQEKFYYFCLAAKNASDVIIVKSPSDNKEAKKFLGYEWSSAKGNEGIHYLATQSLHVEEDDLDEEDKRILENLQGLGNINTPLYNPKDANDTTKINTLIKNNFTRNDVSIPKELESYVSKARLVDMLDFSRVEFNKGLSLSVSKKVEIESKYPLVKLGELFDIQKGRSITQKDIKDGAIKVVAGGLDFAYYHNVSNRPKNIMTVSASGANAGYLNFWEEAIFASDCTTLYNDNLILSLYAFNVLKQKQEKLFELARGAAQPHVYPKDVAIFKIPLPPLDIQEKIVNECAKVDDEVTKANEVINLAQEHLSEVLQSPEVSMTQKLGDICELKAGKFVSASEIYDEKNKTMYPCYGGNGLRGFTKTFTHEGEYCLIGRQGALCGNVTFVSGKFHATEHAVVVTPKIKLENKWLFHTLIVSNLNQYKTGVAQPGLSVQNLNMVQIPLPSLETQKAIVAKIEALEANINEAKKVIEESNAKKEAILKRYL